MTHIKEPIGIDLIVKPMPLSAEDRQVISAIIAAYKMTGEIPQLVRKAKTTQKVKTAQPKKISTKRSRKNLSATI